MAFEPTHYVPDGGMASWEAPDPTRPSQRLDQWLEVQVVERRGDWANVACGNDWTTWVDARRLLSRAAAPAASMPAATVTMSGGAPAIPTADPVAPWTPSAPVAAPAATKPALGTPEFVRLGAAGAVAVGALLGWIKGFPASAFDVPITSLFSRGSATGPDTGLFLLAAAIVIGARAFVPTLRQAAMLAALGVLGIVGLFAFQLSRDLGGLSITDALGVGVYVTALGGIAGLVTVKATRA